MKLYTQAPFVFCLSISLTDTTGVDPHSFTSRQDRFNALLAEQIKFHLESLGLDDALLKFTDNGWLLMTDKPEKVTALCCLSAIITGKLRDEMSRATGIVADRVPSLRLAICSGRGRSIQLPDGRRDWVSDSARKAISLSGGCLPNEVLIDEIVNGHVSGSFGTRPAGIGQRTPGIQPGKSAEETFATYALGELKAETALGSDNPECFIYTLGAIGKTDEAMVAARKTAERLSGDVSKLDTADEEGLKRNLQRLNRLMASAPDYTGVTGMLNHIRNSGLTPDIDAYNTLISMAPDYDQAKLWLDNLQQEAIRPNITTYNALISKAPDYETASSLMETMRQEGIQPDAFTYRALTSKAYDYKTIKLLLETMQKEGVRPDVVVYNALISRASDYDTAKFWMETMQKEGVQPDINSYNTLISGASDYSVAGAWLETMLEEYIQPNLVSFNRLLPKAPDYGTASSLFDAIRQEGIQPNIVTYNTLISKAPDYDIAVSLLDAMQEEGIRPNTDSYNRLFSKNLSGKSADDILKWYLAQEHHPEEPIQTAITTFRKVGRIDQSLRLALEYPHLQVARKLIREIMDEVFSYLETIKEQGIKPDVVTYSSLISKAPYYSIAESWLETMRKKGVKPNVVTYNTLIFKAPDYETGKSLLQAMQGDGIKPNVITYSTIISKAPDYDTAKFWIDTMRKEAVKPNVITYNALILKANDYETTKSLIETMQKEGIQPDMNSYNALISKAPDYDTAKLWIETMQKEGIQLNVVTYNRLFSKDLSDKSADDILKWYLAQKYHPEEPIQAAIATYRNAGQVDQALRLALEFPHLQVARKLIREHIDEALSYFRTFSDQAPHHSNTDCALGVAFMESGRQTEAQPHLRKALDSIKFGPRRAVIEEWLRQMEIAN